MKFKLNLKMVSLVLISAVLCSACQHLIPKAQGLATTAWTAQHIQRQDHIEVQWKTHSFSFLLYQQQRGQQLEMLALSLTGQQLFKLNFDGQRVQVEQRIEQMQRLPFDYLVRDILYATYPEFIALHRGPERIEQKGQVIYIQQQPVLKIHPQQGAVELENIQVPYQMLISAVDETLTDDRGEHE